MLWKPPLGLLAVRQLNFQPVRQLNFQVRTSLPKWTYWILLQLDTPILGLKGYAHVSCSKTLWPTPKKKLSGPFYIEPIIVWQFWKGLAKLWTTEGHLTGYTNIMQLFFLNLTQCNFVKSGLGVPDLKVQTLLCFPKFTQHVMTMVDIVRNQNRNSVCIKIRANFFECCVAKALWDFISECLDISGNWSYEYIATL